MPILIVAIVPFRAVASIATRDAAQIRRIKLKRREAIRDSMRWRSLP